MSIQRIERALQQTWIDLAVGSVCSSESEPGSCGRRSKADKRKTDKTTTAKYQDAELLCK
jgi:hypothetical protein